MQYLHPAGLCCNCHDAVAERAVTYSTFKLGYLLCQRCETELNTHLQKATSETLRLFFALRSRKLPAILKLINNRYHIAFDIPLVTMLAEVSALYVEPVATPNLLGIPESLIRDHLDSVTLLVISKYQEQVKLAIAK